MAGEKNIKCSSCARLFASKKAMAQHMRDAHAVKSQRPKKSKGAVSTASGAPVSVATRWSNVDSSTLSVSGVDRVEHVAEIKKLPHGGVVVNMLVVPSMFERLKMMASSFQRIRWHQLEFLITPKLSTATSGGYVAAFVKDPGDADIAPGEQSLRWLQSQNTAVAAKWWESTVVKAVLPNSLLYTSSGTEVREYSPGRFVLMVDGAASQSGDVTVTARYRVAFSAVGETVPKGELRHTITVKTQLVTQAGYKGLWYFKTTGSPASDNASMFDPDPKVGSVYMAPFTMSFMDTDNKVDSARYIYFKDENNALFCHGPVPGRVYDAASTSQVDVLEPGDVLVEVYSPSSLNAQGASQSACLSGGPLEDTLNGFLQQLKLLLQSSNLSMSSSSERSQPERALSPFEEISRSMECLQQSLQ